MSGIYIQIPKEFEEHFRKDRFEDSLHRLSADAHLLAGLYEQETAEMLIEAFKGAIPIPDHGRLIDADALMEHLVFIPFDGGNLPAIYASYVRNAPTIIPADKEDE